VAVGQLALTNTFRTKVGIAWSALLAAWFLGGCPRMGDPHLETGFRLGPISTAQEAAVLAAVGIAPHLPAAPKGAFLWGGTSPISGGGCSGGTAYRSGRSDDLIVRTLGCDGTRYVFVFFSGLEGTFEAHGAAVCSLLETQLQIALGAAGGESSVQWWTQGASDKKRPAVGCAGGPSRRTPTPR